MAVVAAAGVAVPALANTSQDSTTPSSDLMPSQEAVSAMQRDLDLTPEQARERLRAESIAARSLSAIRATSGLFYGGAWFDAPTRKLVVGLTETGMADSALVGALRLSGAEVKAVRYSMAALEGTKIRIDSMASGKLPPAVVGWYIDPRTNSVVVEVNSGKTDAAAERFLDWVRADGGSVRMSWTTRVPRPLADIVGGDKFDFAVRGQRGTCSIGFSVAGATTTAAHFVTAGHCTEFGGSALDTTGKRIGRISASTFNSYGDFGMVDVADPSSRLTPTVDKFDGARITVTGAQEAPVGSSVCRSGVTTGFRCGEVTALNQTVNYGNGRIVEGLTRTTACAEPGDSGGPYLSGTEAQGLTSGGSGDCTVGGITFFQPINEALETLGVTLITG